MALSGIVNIYTYKRLSLMARLMSTAEAIRNFRMPFYAKWNEICMKFCSVLCDTCHGTVTGLNVTHLAMETPGDSDCMDILKMKNLTGNSLQ